MKKTLLFALGLAVIPVGVDAQVTPSTSCADINFFSSLEDLRSCAEQGDAGAQVSLGSRYSNGTGVPEDDAEAVRWYRLAAAQGNATGQHNLGVMYANGYGVPEDDAEAVRWYRLAAAQGYPLISVPMGLVEGLPVGLSFAGTAWSESLLISLAYDYEQASLSRVPPQRALMSLQSGN